MILLVSSGLGWAPLILARITQAFVVGGSAVGWLVWRGLTRLEVGWLLAMAVTGPGISQPPADPPELGTWWSPAVEEDKP